MRLFAATLVLAVVASGLALAQADVACHRCLDEGIAARWKALDDEHLASARRLKRVRDLMRQARASGNQQVIRQVQAAYDKVTARWKYIDKQMQAVESDSFRIDLQLQVYGASVRLYDKRKALQEKTRQFDRYRRVQGAAREAVLREMWAQTTLEGKQRMNLGLNSILAGISGAAKSAPKLFTGLRGLRIPGMPSLPATALDRLGKASKSLEKLAGKALNLVDQGTTYGKVDYDIAVDDYSGAAVGVFQIITAHVTDKAVIASTASAGLQVAGALPAITGLGLDFVLIGQSHLQHMDAEVQLERNIREERMLREQYMGRMKDLAGEIKDLKHQESRAAARLARQEESSRRAAEARRLLGQ